MPKLTLPFGDERRPLRLGTWNLELGTAALLLLTGCTVATPLPLTPIQVIEGTWPANAPVVAVASRNYTVKGDTFAYPSVGLAVTRASQKDWEFQPIDNGVLVKSRKPADAPLPTLSVELIAIPAGLDVAAALAADKQALQDQGATLTAAARTVNGMQGEAWAIEQTDAATGTAIHLERIYVPLPNAIVVMIQAQASKQSYDQFKADFDKMIEALVLPGSASSQGQEAATQAG